MKKKIIITIIVILIIVASIFGYYKYNEYQNKNKTPEVLTPDIVFISEDYIKTENVKFSVGEDKYPHITGDVINTSSSTIYVDYIIIKTQDEKGNVNESVTQEIKKDINPNETIQFDVNLTLNNSVVKCNAYGYIK